MTLSALKQDATALTPMMRQYFEIKSNYPDAILFYRLGDFYEMFFDDAVEASKLLDLTLTTRNKNDENPVPLCGIPYHAAESYLAKLIENGKKVVVCEQTEDPKFAKGLVKREVTRVITPGTVIEAQSLDATAHNFLMAVLKSESDFACCVCDVTTGRLEYFISPSAEKVRDEITRLQIRELIYPERDRADADIISVTQSGDGLYHHAAPDLHFDPDFAADLIKSQYGVASPDALDVAIGSDALRVLGGMLGSLKDAKLLAPGLLAQPRSRPPQERLFLDEASFNNLEIFRTLRDRKRHGTLAWHLDACATPMGSRQLCEMLRAPLLDSQAIDARLDAVSEFTRNEAFMTATAASLDQVSDLERLANRFVLGIANPRDAVALANSLEKTNALKQALNAAESKSLLAIKARLNDFPALCDTIKRTVLDEPATSLRDGGIIRDGVSRELDELRTIERSGKDFILDIERRERERTGISSLKIRYNNVFGYYIEITNAHKDKAPVDYIRKQTLSNAERYITDELKDYEAKVLGAAERIKSIEQGLFAELAQNVATHAAGIKESADAVGYGDALLSFATIARRFNYVRPVVTSSPGLDIRGARHPVLEHLHAGERFVPNDVCLDAGRASELIITGPNMAGKSTLMRMTALIALMAQAGSFVPCESAEIGVCDRIFTRIGAHDHLQKGLSTFMVEMVETARILREATPRSLVLLDEIGRGTSTFDGLSIAWAVAEELAKRGTRTLFATHYHELCDLAERQKGVRNFHMAVKEWNGEIIFLRKLVTGGTNRSYGVAVASMAGLPQAVVKRARDVLKLLEIKDLSFQNDVAATPETQLTLFQNTEHPVIKELRDAALDKLSPLEALNFLARLKSEL